MLQGGPKTRGRRLMTTILFERIKKIFAGKFLGRFVVKRILKLPSPHTATLPCETLMSARQAINDKLRGSVATY